MKRRHFMMLPGVAFLARQGSARGQQSKPAGGANASDLDKLLPDKVLVKDYYPKSIFKIPKTEVKKAKYPIVDVHHHARAKTPEDLDNQIKLMDAVGVQKTVVFSGATGERFDAVYKLYSRFPDRFDVWCGFDMSEKDKPGFGPAAVKELERCRRVGAKGVGEIVDKGRGIGGNLGTGPAGFPGSGQPPANGIHPDDPRMDALWEKCADLGLPINLHMSDPIWGYQKQDRYNDGLMNGFSWRMDDKPDIMGHNELIECLDSTLKKHPRTVFICCHLANLEYDLERLGRMFQNHPNMFVDISARFAETATIPRTVSRFIQKNADRVTYGTDMAYNQRMFSTTFRIMETSDEHFYERDLNFNFDYHWPLNGFGLPDPVLKKVYVDTALKAFKQAQSNAKA